LLCIYIYINIVLTKQLKTDKTNYSKFILEVLKSVTVKPTKDEMQFAYIVYCGFKVTPLEAINISLEN